MKMLVVAGLCGLLSACAGLSLPGAPGASSDSSLQALATFTVTDLQAADADAVANHDDIAHACYPALEQFIQSLPSSNAQTTVVGAFSAFQKLRDLRNVAVAGVPVYVTMGAAPSMPKCMAIFWPSSRWWRRSRDLVEGRPDLRRGLLGDRPPSRGSAVAGGEDCPWLTKLPSCIVWIAPALRCSMPPCASLRTSSCRERPVSTVLTTSWTSAT